METRTYTKEVGNVTYIISSVANTKETEKVLADKLKKLMIQAVKDSNKPPITSGK